MDNPINFIKSDIRAQSLILSEYKFQRINRKLSKKQVQYMKCL